MVHLDPATAGCRVDTVERSKQGDHVTEPSRIIEVFADVGCPFTHVGLRRFVARRRELGRDDVLLWVRSWPLEIVNGKPLDPVFIAEEIDEIRDQVEPELFVGFSPDTFPSSSLSAMALAAAVHRQQGPAIGEQVSLALRDLLFEVGTDISDGEVLAKLASDHGVTVEPVDHESVMADLAEGADRGVVGSPHFFTPGGGFFCPALDVSRDASGHLRISADPEGFGRFVDSCFD
jgi:predicted DsbA family dithiol-disulfide isomerase